MGTPGSTDTAAPTHAECVPQAVRETLAMTCGFELEDRPDGGDAQMTAIFAVVSLIGDVDWAVYLALPSETAEQLAAKFAGFDIPFDSEDMGDAIGELANIVVGQVKSNLYKLSLNAEISLPTVMRGRDVCLMGNSSGPQASFWFDSPAGALLAGVMCVEG